MSSQQDLTQYVEGKNGLFAFEPRFINSNNQIQKEIRASDILNGKVWSLGSGDMVYAPDRNKIRIQANQKIAFMQFRTISYHNSYLPTSPSIGDSYRRTFFSEGELPRPVRFHFFGEDDIHIPYAKARTRDNSLLFYFFDLGNNVGKKYPLYTSNTKKNAIGDVTSIDIKRHKMATHEVKDASMSFEYAIDIPTLNLRGSEMEEKVKKMRNEISNKSITYHLTGRDYDNLVLPEIRKLETSFWICRIYTVAVLLTKNSNEISVLDAVQWGFSKRKKSRKLKIEKAKIPTSLKLLFNLILSWNESSNSWPIDRKLDQKHVVKTKDKGIFYVDDNPDRSGIEKWKSSNNLITLHRKSKHSYPKIPPRIKINYDRSNDNYYQVRISEQINLGKYTLAQHHKLLRREVKNGKRPSISPKYTIRESKRIEDAVNDTHLYDTDALRILDIMEHDPQNTVDQLVQLVYDLYKREKEERMWSKRKKKEKRILQEKILLEKYFQEAEDRRKEQARQKEEEEMDQFLEHLRDEQYRQRQRVARWVEMFEKNKKSSKILNFFKSSKSQPIPTPSDRELLQYIEDKLFLEHLSQIRLKAKNMNLENKQELKRLLMDAAKLLKQQRYEISELEKIAQSILDPNEKNNAKNLIENKNLSFWYKKVQLQQMHKRNRREQNLSKLDSLPKFKDPQNEKRRYSHQNFLHPKDAQKLKSQDNTSRRPSLLSTNLFEETDEEFESETNPDVLSDLEPLTEHSETEEYMS